MLKGTDMYPHQDDIIKSQLLLPSKSYKQLYKCMTDIFQSTNATNGLKHATRRCFQLSSFPNHVDYIAWFFIKNSTNIFKREKLKGKLLVIEAIGCVQKSRI